MAAEKVVIKDNKTGKYVLPVTQELTSHNNGVDVTLSINKGVLVSSNLDDIKLNTTPTVLQDDGSYVKTSLEGHDHSYVIAGNTGTTILNASKQLLIKGSNGVEVTASETGLLISVVSTASVILDNKLNIGNVSYDGKEEITIFAGNGISINDTDNGVQISGRSVYAPNESGETQELKENASLNFNNDFVYKNNKIGIAWTEV